MINRVRILGLMALCALLFAAGCERQESMSLTSEDSEPYFERGKQFIRQGRNQEALASFLKVISKRGDEAPESHLEAALIYQAHIKDHLAAIYHFRKFLELQPNSRQADLVKQRIEASKREFARSLPAHPMEDASVKLGFMDQLDRLQRENEQLKAELTALRGGLPTGVMQGSYSRGGFDIPVAPATKPNQAEAPEEESPITRAPIVIETPSASGNSGRSIIESLSKPGAPMRTGTQAGAPTSVGGKKHTVGQGDTLYVLAQRYYGNKSRWREIYQANRDQLKSESDKLRIGMELKIP
ncbi:MAG: LysM peptidoglycan-binding domain-containing protein [Opitutaceae bacterium]|jgi:tetratricopeptide (TPR) repeat protein